MISGLPSPREVSGVTRDNFKAKVVDLHEPVVMRGVGREWNIVKAAQNSPEAVVDYLNRFDSGRMAEFAVSPHAEGGRLSYNDRLDGINFTWEKSTIAAGLRRILDRKLQAGDPNFAFQSIAIPELLPGLEREVSSPFLPPTIPPTIWIGSQVVVPAHFDEASNLAFVVSGRRRFTLFPPEQVGNMYVGRLDFTPAGQPVSLVDPRAPDLDRFPRFAKAMEAALSVELEPGDAIHIPSPWWHHIESLERLNILVNYFWSHVRIASAAPFTCLVHAIHALRDLPPGERDAWKAFLDHYVFETNGDPVEHLAGFDTGILGPKNPVVSENIHKYLLDRMQPTGRRS
ncbi:MAG: hypothetical protein ACI9H8_000576 [Lysobacterales bacterium]|jgi:hypothetical protein